MEKEWTQDALGHCMPRPPAQTDGLRLDESHASLERKGFDEQFRVKPGGLVLCLACDQASPAKSFPVESQKRVEGVSDPDEQSIVVALHCPACEAKGTLTLAFGPRAGRDEAAVLSDLAPPREPAGRRGERPEPRTR